MNHDRGSSLVKQANKAMREGKYNHAIEIYKEIIKIHPGMAGVIEFNLTFCKSKLSKTPLEIYNKYFDAEWYRNKYMESNCKTPPLDHYKENYRTKRVNPNQYFDSNYVISNESLSSQIDPLDYYLNSLEVGGIDFLLNGFSPTPFFDRKFYLGHSDVYQQALNGYDPYLHYLEHGCKERRAAYHWHNYNEIVRHRQFFTEFCNTGSYFSKADSLKFATGELAESFYLNNQKAIAKKLKERPLISILTPIYQTNPRFLIEMIESVLSQTYDNWQLCLVDDASKINKNEIHDIVKTYADRDSRIAFKVREKNGHICAASNDALSLAIGEYVALLDHDDTLTPDAIYEVALAIIEQSSPDIIYSDEDKVTEWGVYCGPYYKPDWSPYSLLARMYCCHLSVYKRTLLEKVGGFRLGYEGSQDHDLLLRCSEIAKTIYHIPKVLYHWRMHEESTAGSEGGLAKEYCSTAALNAVKDAMQRRGIDAEVTLMLKNHSLINVKPKVINSPLVNIIIPSRDGVAYLAPCLQSIFDKSTYVNYIITVINNRSTSNEFYQLMSKWEIQEPERFNVIEIDVDFNFSKLNNMAALDSTGEYLLFLNNDTEVITPDWIELLLGYAQLEDIGAVGAKLLYEDESIQHAGVVTGPTGIATHVMAHQPRFAFGYNSNLALLTNYSAVTAACMLINKNKFFKVNGFDENLAVAFNDIDFCLKVRDSGYYNIYVPYAELFHYESKTRGYEDSKDKVIRFEREIMYMRQKWGMSLERDPFYSKWLTMKDSTMGYSFQP